MTRTIVVMGGSFNPPTAAHQKMLLAAMESLGADKGFYVPTSERALRRKMRKTEHPEEVLSQQTRFAMLQAMAQEDARIEVEDVEYRNPNNWYTLETLRHIQEKYPGAEIYCLIGTDKLDLFSKAYRLPEFLEQFRYAVIRRDGEDPEAVLRGCPAAWKKRDRFCILPAPEGIAGVSSTAVRDALRTGENVPEEMLHPRVREMLSEQHKADG